MSPFSCEECLGRIPSSLQGLNLHKASYHVESVDLIVNLKGTISISKSLIHASSTFFLLTVLLYMYNI